MTYALNLVKQTFLNQTKETISARDLHTILGSKRKFADWIKDRLQGYEENIDFIAEKINKKTRTGGSPLVEYWITQDVIIECVQKELSVSSSKKRDILESLNIKESHILHSKMESEFFEILEQVLAPFNYQCFRGCKILDCRVDFYIQDLNTVIEHDEEYHKYRKKDDIKRQTKITQAINCKFIRVSTDKGHLWNCGYVLKNLFL